MIFLECLCKIINSSSCSTIIKLMKYSYFHFLLLSTATKSLPKIILRGKYFERGCKKTIKLNSKSFILNIGFIDTMLLLTTEPSKPCDLNNFFKEKNVGSFMCIRACELVLRALGFWILG